MSDSLPIGRAIKVQPPKTTSRYSIKQKIRVPGGFIVKKGRGRPPKEHQNDASTFPVFNQNKRHGHGTRKNVEHARKKYVFKPKTTEAFVTDDIELFTHPCFDKDGLLMFQPPARCSLCLGVVADLSLIAKHSYNQHKMYQCYNCHGCFKRGEDYVEHRRWCTNSKIHLDHVPDDSFDPGLVCNVCDLLFLKKENFHKHDYAEEKSNIFMKHILSRHWFNYCTECRGYFPLYFSTCHGSIKSSLRRCIYCLSVFDSYSKLKEHLLDYHKIYHCEFCLKYISSCSKRSDNIEKFKAHTKECVRFLGRCKNSQDFNIKVRLYDEEQEKLKMLKKEQMKENELMAQSICDEAKLNELNQHDEEGSTTLISPLESPNKSLAAETGIFGDASKLIANIVEKMAPEKPKDSSRVPENTSSPSATAVKTSVIGTASVIKPPSDSMNIRKPPPVAGTGSPKQIIVLNSSKIAPTWSTNTLVQAKGITRNSILKSQFICDQARLAQQNQISQSLPISHISPANNAVNMPIISPTLVQNSRIIKTTDGKSLILLTKAPGAKVTNAGKGVVSVKVNPSTTAPASTANKITEPGKQIPKPSDVGNEKSALSNSDIMQILTTDSPVAKEPTIIDFTEKNHESDKTVTSLTRTDSDIADANKEIRDEVGAGESENEKSIEDGQDEPEPDFLSKLLKLKDLINNDDGELNDTEEENMNEQEGKREDIASESGALKRKRLDSSETESGAELAQEAGKKDSSETESGTEGAGKRKMRSSSETESCSEAEVPAKRRRESNRLDSEEDTVNLIEEPSIEGNNMSVTQKENDDGENKDGQENVNHPQSSGEGTDHSTNTRGVSRMTWKLSVPKAGPSQTGETERVSDTVSDSEEASSKPGMFSEHDDNELNSESEKNNEHNETLEYSEGSDRDCHPSTNDHDDDLNSQSEKDNEHDETLEYSEGSDGDYHPSTNDTSVHESTTEPSEQENPSENDKSAHEGPVEHGDTSSSESSTTMDDFTRQLESTSSKLGDSGKQTREQRLTKRGQPRVWNLEPEEGSESESSDDGTCLDLSR